MKWRYAIICAIPVVVVAAVLWAWRADTRDVEADGYRDATWQATETANFLLHDLAGDVKRGKAGASLRHVLASTESDRVATNYLVLGENRALFRATGQSVRPGRSGLPSTYFVMGCFSATLVGQAEFRVAEAECADRLIPAVAPPRVLHPPWFTFDPLS